MKVRLIKGLSYRGRGVTATAASPFVVCDNKLGAELVETGYFAEVKEEVKAVKSSKTAKTSSRG